MKNHDLIITHLNETIRALQRIVVCLETRHLFGTRKPMRYREMHLRGHLEHVQHHINCAWHIRDVPREQAIDTTKVEFEQGAKQWMPGGT